MGLTVRYKRSVFSIFVLSLFTLLSLSNCGTMGFGSPIKIYTLHEIVDFNNLCMVFGDDKMFRVITSDFEMSAPIEISDSTLSVINDVVKAQNHVFTVYNKGVASLSIESKHLGFEQLNDASNLNSIACGDKSCLAVSYFGTIVYHNLKDSYKNWQQFTNSSIPLGIKKILYYQDKYFIITDSGELYSSATDGKSWDKILIPSEGNSLNSIRILNGELYITGDNGTLLSSSDTVRWVKYDSKMFLERNLEDITFGVKKFVLIGEHGLVFVSGWNKKFVELKQRITISNLTKVAFFNNRFIAVGYGGVIFISKDAKKWHLLPIGAEYKLNIVCRSVNISKE